MSENRRNRHQEHGEADRLSGGERRRAECLSQLGPGVSLLFKIESACFC